ncbi:hypothetical protein XHC_2660 [Xanthomonas hortorum pv. carotae str. M081]|nr:hypothetical protein XHC_2660 [Xanthomonas hortorum pv. carotae str. M081]
MVAQSQASCVVGEARATTCRSSGSGEGGATIQLFEPPGTDCVTSLVSCRLD